VPGRVKRNADAVQIEFFAVFNRINVRLRRAVKEAVFEDGNRLAMSEVTFGATPDVVGMGVRNDVAINRLPRINVEPTGRAMQAARRVDDEITRHSADYRFAICAGGMDERRHLELART